MTGSGSMCGKCGGLIGEPGKSYSYAGKFCHCQWTDNKQGNPAFVETIKELAAMPEKEFMQRMLNSKCDDYDKLQTRHQALLEASKKLAEALRQIRELTLNRFDKTEDINILANQSVASFNSFLKEQGDL